MNEQLKHRLTAQFYRGNHAVFALAVFASLGGGTMNLLLSWILQQLIDTISGEPNALSLSALGVISLATSLLTGKWVQAAERRVSDANQSFTAALADCLGGFSVVRPSARSARYCACSPKATARWRAKNSIAAACGRWWA